MRVYNQEDSPQKENRDNKNKELYRFSVLYAKLSTRKHKKWENDGILSCYDGYTVLKSEDDSTVISRSTSIKKFDELVEGFVLKMGSLEVQIQQQIIIEKQHEIIQSASNSTLSSLQTKSDLKRLASPSNAIQSKRVCKNFISPFNDTSLSESNSFHEESESKPVEIALMFERYLRPHQIDGISFIYKNLKNPTGGVILADEMGLGKTVQTLAALFSLMGNKLGRSSIIQRCLLVVPSSLVNNWKAEFKKWFGIHRIPVIAVSESSDVKSYVTAFKYFPFLLISYDMTLRTLAQLKQIQFNVIICDEAHRLKNINGKVRKSLYELNIPRRILLTGTPLQNDLEELFSLLDFVRPGQFGTWNEFSKRIKEKEDKQIVTQISEVMLRRTAELNKTHLPPKHEYVIFCKQSQLQTKLLIKLSDYMTAGPFKIIDYMKKVSNHPAMLFKHLTEKLEQDRYVDQLLESYPSDFGGNSVFVKDSGKLAVLLKMLAKFRMLNECTVVVSNYTKTLDMIEGVCNGIGLTVLRLDGDTSVNERQKLVNKFNLSRDPSFVFLLSTKAGGVGLNLIGASRLVLFDFDWNPASDLQAMARIWRDGQQRSCHIYRLCTSGSIDEKIFQRQVQKTGLSTFIENSESKTNIVKFRDEDLLDIFTVSENSECNTHDLLECKCAGNGILQSEVKDGFIEEDLEHDELEEMNNSIPETSEELKVDNVNDVNSEMNNIILEVNEEEKIKEVSKTEDNSDVENNEEIIESASMSELYLWKHFSPSSPAWETFVTTSGLDYTDSDITFAFYFSTEF